MNFKNEIKSQFDLSHIITKTKLYGRDYFHQKMNYLGLTSSFTYLNLKVTLFWKYCLQPDIKQICDIDKMVCQMQLKNNYSKDNWKSYKDKKW